MPPLDPAAAHALLLSALRDDPAVAISAALDGSRVVGVAASVLEEGGAARRLLALGVAPAARGAGLGRALLQAHLAAIGECPIEALVTVAERDPVDPLAIEDRTGIARRLLASAGFDDRPVPPAVAGVDGSAVMARRA